ncbi:endo alpha-1,4 polygalactosaminidase [Amycolatopsis speibonae]|uniref:Endo alpha-1,4 polygalactosaminidase n=1 Tax=Amycolatopsis speibonae TaxID=1450224 RepID=A0ABV7PG50_9PSEU
MPTLIRSSMMHTSRVLAVAALCAVVVVAGAACSATVEPEPTSTPAPPPAPPPAPAPTPAHAFAPPPVKAGFDYQIGSPYAPPSGVRVVSRDHTAPPAAGLYNICYINAFQAQPRAEGEWGDLALRGANGAIVMDVEWGEALLDLRTTDKRQQVAAKVNGWADDCAAKGYQAIELDNFDSFTRSNGLLSDGDAQAYIRLLSAHAHEKGLAIGQKNASELAGQRQANGLDFAVVEECGEQDNCDEYIPAYGDNVIAIEYTDAGLANACDKWGGSLSIVRRDHDVLPAGASGYVRKTC